MKKQQNNDDGDAQMKKTKTTPLPDPPPKGGASPRRHQTSQWLHDHQQQRRSPIDITRVSMPPLNDATTPVQNPSPPLQQSKPLSPRSEKHQHEHEPLSPQQRNASAFMAAFLRDAASVTVPTKTSDQIAKVVKIRTDSCVEIPIYGSARSEDSGKIIRSSSIDSSKQKFYIDKSPVCLDEEERRTHCDDMVNRIHSGNKQQKFVRKNTYGTAKYEDCDNISRSSSIDLNNFSECLNEVVRSTTKRGENITCEITTTKTKKSGGQTKKGSRRLWTTSTSAGESGGESEDDGSIVTNFSDWNELLEKTFGPDDSHSEGGHVQFDMEKHVSELYVGEGISKRPCGEGSASERSSSGHRVAPTNVPTIRPTASHSSTPTTSPPGPPKPILKKKDYNATADTERLTTDTLLDELIALDDSVQTSYSDSPGRQYYKRQPKSPRLSSSMGNVCDMMEDMFIVDECLEHYSSETALQKTMASLKERANTNERAQKNDRLRKKKAAVHTKALRDSIQSKPGAHASPNEPRPRTNSYDDADRFLWSLEQARELHKVEENSTKDLGGSSKPVHRVRGDEEDTKSLNAFDEMLADIEDEERRIESTLFGSKSKSSQRERLFSKQKKGGMLSSRPSEHSLASLATNTSFATNATGNRSLARNTTKVICLKWVDRRGMLGHFTGEVNELIQPHGKGILVYENGLVLDCHWCNGTPTTGTNDDTKVAAETQTVPSKKFSHQFHPDYDLGMTARSPHDMKEEDPETAMEGISRLKTLDFAFVRRSDKKWTYSIISDRTDDSIRFVVDELGRTKKINRDGWLKNVRRIRVQKNRDRADDDHSRQQQKTHSRHHGQRSTQTRKKLEP